MGQQASNKLKRGDTQDSTSSYEGDSEDINDSKYENNEEENIEIDNNNKKKKKKKKNKKKNNNNDNNNNRKKGFVGHRFGRSTGGNDTHEKPKRRKSFIARAINRIRSDKKTKNTTAVEFNDNLDENLIDVILEDDDIEGLDSPTITKTDKKDLWDGLVEKKKLSSQNKNNEEIKKKLKESMEMNDLSTPEENLWFYYDETDTVQGKYNDDDMKWLLSQNAIHGDTMIYRNEDEGWTLLKKTDFYMKEKNIDISKEEDKKEEVEDKKEEVEDKKEEVEDKKEKIEDNNNNNNNNNENNEIKNNEINKEEKINEEINNNKEDINDLNKSNEMKIEKHNLRKSLDPISISLPENDDDIVFFSHPDLEMIPRFDAQFMRDDEISSRMMQYFHLKAKEVGEMTRRLSDPSKTKRSMSRDESIKIKITNQHNNILDQKTTQIDDISTLPPIPKKNTEKKVRQVLNGLWTVPSR